MSEADGFSTVAPAQAVPSLEELKAQRSSSKGSITRIRNIVEGNSNLAITELECRLSMVETYYKQASYYQTQIERITPLDLGRSDIDELYVSAKTFIASRLGYNRRCSMQDGTFNSSLPSMGAPNRLPKLRLPRFSGNYIDYKNFITSFNSLVHNELNIPVIEKFNYLLSCLTDDALATVKAFPVAEENYEKALNRLRERFDNDTLIFLENISTIFAIEKVTKPDSKQIRRTVDAITALYNSLTSLGSLQQICDAMMIHVLMSKVDVDTRHKWNESLDYRSLPSYASCCLMLDKRCQQLEANRNDKGQPSHAPSKSKAKQYALVAETKLVCQYCTKPGHAIFKCYKFENIPPEERENAVNRLSLCTNCLSTGHNSDQCQSKFSCRICKRRHHTKLHNPESNQTEEPRVFSPESVVVHTISEQNHVPSGNVLLATAVIHVMDSYGNFHPCRALLDSCSQVNILSEKTCAALKLKRTKSETDIFGVGNVATKIPFKTQTTIRSRITDFNCCLEFLIAKTITGYHPGERLSKPDLTIPNSITLADPDFHVPRGVDILLGAEVFFSIIESGKISLGINLPTLQNSSLGWMIAGKWVSTHSPLKAQVNCTTVDTLDSLNKNVERFWRIEEGSTKRKRLTAEQEECENHFIENTFVDDTGRITVKLPFKGDPSLLGNSRDIAERRFLSLERKFKCKKQLYEDYSQFMKEYQELGHMSLMSSPELQNPHYFIPHHCVIKASSETTKLRVVFDASCATSSHKSLNDLLMVGPTIQNDLFITLLRFRCHRYGLLADITKMYRQFNVHPDHRNLQLILWRADKSQPLSVYQLNTITYGLAAAPFLAIRSLQYAADNFPLPHETGKNAIKNDFYVDDMVTGADDLHTLRKIKAEVSEILSYYHLSLSKWHCNHPSMEVFESCNFKFDDGITTTLGVSWHPDKDEFMFSFDPTSKYAFVTKRSILSITSSLFDPLGLIAPALIRAKILLQQLWIKGLNWDDPVPQEIEFSWHQIISDLKTLLNIRIPRFVKSINTVQIDVHGFGDASTKAYGCCIYLRCEDSTGHVEVRLLSSRSRVAPLKTRSLPRLELCAAHLLASFWDQFKSMLPFSVRNIIFWSDSQLTLHWINSESSTLTVFVGNRVADIQEKSNQVSWRYVPTALNPADLISRGCNVESLQSPLWLNGPSFLSLNETEWPNQVGSTLTLQDRNLEKRSVALLAHNDTPPYLLSQINKYSNFNKIVRIIARCLRFGKMSEQDPNIITADEFQRALLRIVYVIQQFHFEDETHQLEKEGILKGSLASLGVFIDYSNDFPLLRVGGRLANSNLPEKVKFPLLLPRRENFVQSLVVNLHRQHYHAGPQALVALTQQQFWIINCRTLASQVVKQCIHCSRYRPKLMSQIMGNLPRNRVTASSPFENIGVDFAGPIPTYLKIRGKTPYKSYIAVFICFATKAVHLEAVSDLSSDAFIAALKRLVARRGMPAKIFCDNATNFVGADKKLKEFNEHFHRAETKSAISSYCTQRNIEFSFIPPRAPHFGGLWEAAVKVAKSHLYRTLLNARLTFEELSTALAEIEAIMNSRPLLASSSNPNDLEALTPAHFLIGKRLTDIPERRALSSEISHLERWERIKAVKAHFWQRWSHEYLVTLQNRWRWQKPQRELKIGDMVLIQDENLPPMKWSLGRILSVFPGNDQHVRVAEVRTPSTVLRRPISKMAVLPVN